MSSRMIRLAYAISIALVPLGFVTLVSSLGVYPDWRGAFLCTALLLAVVARCEWMARTKKQP